MSNQQFTPAQKKVLIKLISEENSNTLTTDNYRSVEKLIKMNILVMNGHYNFEFKNPKMAHWFECWNNEIKK